MESWERGSKSQPEAEGRPSQPGLLTKDALKPCQRDQVQAKRSHLLIWGNGDMVLVIYYPSSFYIFEN